MNWDAVSAVGEILSAVGVMVTLIYLATQVRQNTQATRSATFQAINDGMSTLSQVVATHPHLVRLFREGRGGLASLSPDDRMSFSFTLMTTMRRLQAVHVQRDLGMVDDEYVEGYEISVMSALVEIRGAMEWWENARHAFPSSFTERIDELARAHELGSGTHLGIPPEHTPDE